MAAPAGFRLIGRWRIVEADIWDRAYLNLERTRDYHDHRSAMAKSPLAPSRLAPPGKASTKWTKVSGDGPAELLDDGTIEIESARSNGDDAVLKANA